MALESHLGRGGGGRGVSWWGKISSHTEFFFNAGFTMTYAVYPWSVHCKCSQTVRDTWDRFIFTFGIYVTMGFLGIFLALSFEGAHKIWWRKYS